MLIKFTNFLVERKAGKTTRAREAAAFNIFVKYLYKMYLPVFISEILLNAAASLARVVFPLHLLECC